MISDTSRCSRINKEDTHIIHALTSARGLISIHNRKGHEYSMITLRRWLRVNRLASKALKVDVIGQTTDTTTMDRLLDAAQELDMRLSWRSNTLPPETRHVMEWKSAGLLDVMACVSANDTHMISNWLELAQTSKLSLRLELLPPFPESASALISMLSSVAPVHIQLCLRDPFVSLSVKKHPKITSSTSLYALAQALHDAGHDVRITGVPFCLVDASLRPYVVTLRQYAMTHQYYIPGAFDLALQIYRLRPVWADKALLMLLGRYASFPNPIDEKLLPWILDYPWLRARIWAWHKLTRHLNLLRSAPKVIDGESQEHNMHVPSPCTQCSMQARCDYGSTPYLPRSFKKSRHMLDTSEHVDLVPEQYCDEVEEIRRNKFHVAPNLVEEARRIVATQEPDHEFDSFSYKVENVWSWQLAGSLRWFSWTNTEKTSTPLTTISPPFTLSMTMGGGTAEYAGFAFGCDARIVCPMETYAHRLTLHADYAGNYVLLRDGIPIQPVEFTGSRYVPLQLHGRLEPRIVLGNIDGTAGTQGVFLWKPHDEKPTLTEATDISIVIVCTRYARRLAACLASLAHQEDISPERYEVLIAYVPGIDATGDVLDGASLSWPHLRIIPMPFREDHATAKGYLINTCAQAARGEWVILLDADIVLHPGMLRMLMNVHASSHFVCPDGRKMLTPETTSRVLFGEILPWRDWGALMEGPGEYRRSEAEDVPVGFCQCVRRSCFEQVSYVEMNHFEGADWRFAQDIRKAFGNEYRLDGMPVLHLDHGGSQWYGTTRHR